MRVLVLCIFIVMTSCGRSGKNSSAENPNLPFESFTLHLRDKVLSGGSSNPKSICHVELGHELSEAGICQTPLKLNGWLNNIALSTSQDTQDTPIFLLNHGHGLQSNGQWEGAAFDAKQTLSLSGKSSLEKAYKSKPEFDRVHLNFLYISFQVLIGPHYWNVLIPFYSQAVQQSSIVQSCQFNANELANIQKNANLLGERSFQRGDFLFCIKSTDQNCMPSEYNFFDLETLEFTATRTSSALYSEYIVDLPASCAPATANETRPRLDWGVYPMRAKFSTPVSLYADYSHGPESQKPSGDAGLSGLPPYKMYYYNQEGKMTTGNDLNFVIEFDTQHMIFAQGFSTVEELEAAPMADIAQSITLRPLFQAENDPLGSTTEPTLTATPQITLQTLSNNQLQTKR